MTHHPNFYQAVLLQLVNRPPTSDWPDILRTLLVMITRDGDLTALSVALPRFAVKLEPKHLEDWDKVVQDVLGPISELEIGVRMSKAVSDFRRTNDRRALLQLPLEERSLLKPILPNFPEGILGQYG